MMNERHPNTQPADRLETLGRSLIQHGKSNDRVYLMKLDGSDYPAIIEQMDTLAAKEGYTKIFVKIPSRYEAAFSDAGFSPEAHVPMFYSGSEDAFFMAKYFDQKRAVLSNGNEVKAVIERAETAAPLSEPDKQSGLVCRILLPEDAGTLAALYRIVFETYPFPIHDPAFLIEAMNAETVFFGIFHNGRLAAASSSEMDVKSENVEMTDFATLPEFRARGLAARLLHEMEREMKKRGIKTAYTIARAVSYGMNITFARQGYALAGTLVNNTNISGSLESMNVWYKPLNNSIR